MLKQQSVFQCEYVIVAVTPCVGVWIEILFLVARQNAHNVTPCVGVWIEIEVVRICDRVGVVTPCVGVWIEILLFFRWNTAAIVTPCVGVWIEIIAQGFCEIVTLGHSLRGSVD